MVGTYASPGVYEHGDQVNYPRAAIVNENKHHISNALGYMPKDQNRAMAQMIEEDTQEEIAERYKRDPTYSATMNGHEPSRGAKVDADIKREEEELLKKKKEKTDSLPGKKL